MAALLLAAKGLDKTAIGELLGGFDDDEVAVKRALAKSHDSAGTTRRVRRVHVVCCLGEARKIDRLMEAFAAKY